MYLFFLIATAAYFTGTAILDAQKTRRLMEIEITEEVRVRFYIGTIIWGWGAVLAVLIMCLIADIGFTDVGFRQISFEHNTIFTVITLVACGLLSAGFLYQTISCLVSAKYREAIKAKFSADADKNGNKSVAENLLIPRSKKEKKIFFYVSLTAGVSEEILSRGFLFFLMQSVFPDISIIIVVAITSALFGIWHIYQGLQGIIRSALAGAVFGCLFVAVGSVVPAILLHFFLDYSSAFLLSEE